ncbi:MULTISPECIES: Maf family nucleotide pyrophosphatase [unclassified Siphonobacter]|uniref:Maf family nucleotide pyrophosphatase n=1 Tax=unclassified Siphonobacter TaxID=2635712 RepID=UPI000CC7A4E1|nr:MULTISPECIES: Maf family nucleotide pyrophosphatase [unclassified Siphonobacter]MDQ1086277.1 septum formation protein [Siphonobacter sp. SORGH_AS_1065]PKK35817.1 septum formation protein Maf [Siphonobacter sp. SORGH_AS_0500]
MLLLTQPLILGSNSPRRQQILRDAGFSFQVQVLPTEEDFPEDMPSQEVPVFLARKKAEAFRPVLENNLVLTADTVVRINEKILNKPTDPADARRMLKLLSGHTHEVTTGVCLMSAEQTLSFADTARVHFRELTDWEIDYYLEACRPFDKAGAYGVQDFIGMVGIDWLEGSYFTVMGLPIHRVYEALSAKIRR